jgi:hypothetical protein
LLGTIILLSCTFLIFLNLIIISITIKIKNIKIDIGITIIKIDSHLFEIRIYPKEHFSQVPIDSSIFEYSKRLKKS